MAQYYCCCCAAILSDCKLPCKFTVNANGAYARAPVLLHCSCNYHLHCSYLLTASPNVPSTILLVYITNPVHFFPYSTLAALYATSCMWYSSYNPLIRTTSSTSSATSAYIATRSIQSKNFDKLSCSLYFMVESSNLIWCRLLRYFALKAPTSACHNSCRLHLQ